MADLSQLGCVDCGTVIVICDHAAKRLLEPTITYSMGVEEELCAQLAAAEARADREHALFAQADSDLSDITERYEAAESARAALEAWMSPMEAWMTHAISIAADRRIISQDQIVDGRAILFDVRALLAQPASGTGECMCKDASSACGACLAQGPASDQR